jgi:hypothetical protein
LQRRSAVSNRPRYSASRSSVVLSGAITRLPRLTRVRLIPRSRLQRQAHEQPPALVVALDLLAVADALGEGRRFGARRWRIGDHAGTLASGISRTRRSSGHSSGSPPLPSCNFRVHPGKLRSNRGSRIARLPSCFTNAGTSAALHCATIDRTHSASHGRAFAPLSPPTIHQWMSGKSERRCPTDSLHRSIAATAHPSS